MSVQKKFFKDILTDAGGHDFDFAAAFSFLMGGSLVLLAAYDTFQAYHSYYALIEAKVTPIPPIPVFNFQSFGLGDGSILTALGAHKFLDKKSQGGNNVQDS